MVDLFLAEQRSNIMRSVKSRNNKSTEIKLLNFFKIHKINGWRRSFELFGKPDFVFPKDRIAVFVDGCFWHGHNCRNINPKNNKNYWQQKITKNKKRDILVNKTLKNKNWKIIRIKECELKKENILLKKFKSII